MTQRDKLVARIKARPPRARYSDVRALLEAFGWSVDRQDGSHVTFVKDGERSLTIALVKGRSVKAVYLAKICDQLGI